jgi:hypothetical protein
MAALVCVAAGVAQPTKIRLKIEGVSHTHAAGAGLLCARISGTAGSTLFVEAYGPGVPEQHTWKQSLLPRRGSALVTSALVTFAITAEGAYRIKVTANKPKEGRSVATSDYVVPPEGVSLRGRFACA